MKMSQIPKWPFLTKINTTVTTKNDIIVVLRHNNKKIKYKIWLRLYITERFIFGIIYIYKAN